MARTMYSKSHIKSCNFWSITFPLIKTDRPHRRLQISRMIKKQRDFNKTVGWYWNNQFKSRMRKNAKMWLSQKCDWLTKYKHIYVKKSCEKCFTTSLWICMIAVSSCFNFTQQVLISVSKRFRYCYWSVSVRSHSIIT